MAKRILVVDADATTRAGVRKLLLKLPVAVDEAADFNGLVDRIRKGRYDLVLMDLAADPDGAFRAADALKSHPETSGVQLLALSAHVDPHRTAGATEQGFEDFITKPVREQELLPLVRFHLGLPHGLNEPHPI